PPPAPPSPASTDRRCFSSAAATAWWRCVNVAQPRPYSPGSEVSILVTTSRMPAGAGRIVFTSLIVIGDIVDPFALNCLTQDGGKTTKDERRTTNEGGNLIRLPSSVFRP